ncbi:MAG: guanylate kinase [Armatimonadota bacterium]
MGDCRAPGTVGGIGISADGGILLVVSGPSGVGKGTVIRRLKTLVPDLAESVSANTRPPREGEVDGVDYYFVSEGEFRRMIEAGEFFEWADVYGELKGTPKEQIRRALSNNVDIVVEVDYQGALAIKEQERRAVLVFLAPPSWAELERRLRGRRTESEEALQRRLRAAVTEIENMDEYDYVVVNDDSARAAEELAAILTAEKRRTARGRWRSLADALLKDADARVR